MLEIYTDPEGYLTDITESFQDLKGPKVIATVQIVRKTVGVEINPVSALITQDLKTYTLDAYQKKIPFWKFRRNTLETVHAYFTTNAYYGYVTCKNKPQGDVEIITFRAGILVVIDSEPVYAKFINFHRKSAHDAIVHASLFSDVERYLTQRFGTIQF